VATTAADNGGLIMTEGVEKNGFCVFSILMSAKEAVCPDGRIVPAVFRVSGFYCNSLFFNVYFLSSGRKKYLFFATNTLKTVCKGKKDCHRLKFLHFLLVIC
jgi:hypothetical protein